ncbi:MAG TPA: cupredoxin domain-containing protein [Candidatus Limnocylindrales bacterium]|nr:cupredoxin domain-containing protein [Candidatus Limnocylindrales bacterium]
MRRHQIAGRGTQLLGGIVQAVLLAGCVAARATPIATPPAPVSVAISSAPGETLAFEPAESTVRAAGPITLTFQNRSSLPHNMTFTAGLKAATQTIVKPGSSDQLLLGPPGPGAYPFVCTIHDGMAGTLIVEPTASVGEPRRSARGLA